MQYFGIGFLLLIFFEIMSIVWVADWLGGGLTFLLMLLSFAAGIFMLRRTGIAGVMLLGASMREGKGVSLYQMLWPVRFVLAGLLLLSPGFVSTAVALILLLPIKGPAISTIRPDDPAGRPFSHGSKNAGGDIVDAEYTVTRAGPEVKTQEYIEHRPD